MLRDWPDGKAELIHRLHCAEDHLRGVAAMIERGADCQSVVQQIIAAQAALGEVTGLIVRRHLTVCLGELKHDTDMDGPTREQYLAEILALYQLCGRSLPPSNRKELL